MALRGRRTMEYKNILIIKMSALGDVMHALPCAAALRDLYPKARITWIVHPQFSAFIPEAPIVDEVIIFDKKSFSKMSFGDKLKEFLRMRKLLRSKRFDLVLDLQGLFKSAVIAWLTGCKTRYGYNDMRECSGYVSKAIHGANDKGHIVQQYLDVIRFLGSDVREPVFPMPRLLQEKKKIQHLLSEKFNDISKDRLIALVPGAGWVTKEWPEDYFIDLAKQLIQQGKYIVLVGGPAEIEKGNKIIEKLPDSKVISLIGKTSLKELAALMSFVGLCIGGDTGPVHIAAAMGTRIIALFGASSGHRAGPYGSNVTIISTDEKCAPCFKRKCPLHKNCMKKIQVATVMQRV